MARKLKALSILIAFMLILPALSIADQMRVVRVLDGDSTTVLMHGEKIGVRLVGADAPEESRKKHETLTNMLLSIKLSFSLISKFVAIGFSLLTITKIFDRRSVP